MLNPRENGKPNEGTGWWGERTREPSVVRSKIILILVLILTFRFPIN